MPESPSHFSEPTEAPPSTERRSPRWQLGLQRLILLIAAIAVWMSVYLNRQQSALLDSRIQAMVPLAHELIVDDPAKVAVVKLEEYWMDDNRWDLYLPPGSYRLCLATRKIDDDGLAPVARSVPIRSGNHRLTLVRERTPESGRVTVSEGKATLLGVPESAEWDPGTGSQGGSQFSRNEQLSPDQPVVLYRLRFTKRIKNGRTTTSRPPKGPTEGILLWIERADGSNPTP